MFPELSFSLDGLASHFEIIISQRTITKDSITYDIANYIHPICGIIELYTFLEWHKRSCNRKIKVMNLINDEVIFLLNDDNYNWGPEVHFETLSECLNGVEVVAYNTPLRITKVVVHDWSINFKETPLYKKLAQKANKILCYGDEYPIYFFLRWKPTSRIKKIDVLNAAIIQENDIYP